MPPRGFHVLPLRRVVERTFAWIGHNRRMAKDYERLHATGEAFVYVAIMRLMVRRLAREQEFPDSLWKECSPNFVPRGFYEVHASSIASEAGRSRWASTWMPTAP